MSETSQEEKQAGALFGLAAPCLLSRELNGTTLQQPNVPTGRGGCFALLKSTGVCARISTSFRRHFSLLVAVVLVSFLRGQGLFGRRVVLSSTCVMGVCIALSWTEAILYVVLACGGGVVSFVLCLACCVCVVCAFFQQLRRRPVLCIGLILIGLVVEPWHDLWMYVTVLATAVYPVMCADSALYRT